MDTGFESQRVTVTRGTSPHEDLTGEPGCVHCQRAGQDSTDSRGDPRRRRPARAARWHRSTMDRGAGVVECECQDDVVRVNPTSAGYLKTMGIPLIAVVISTVSDSSQAPRVAIVNRAFARQLGLQGAIVGQRFRRPTGPSSSGHLLGDCGTGSGLEVLHAAREVSTDCARANHADRRSASVHGRHDPVGGIVREIGAAVARRREPQSVARHLDARSTTRFATPC